MQGFNTKDGQPGTIILIDQDDYIIGHMETTLLMVADLIEVEQVEIPGRGWLSTMRIPAVIGAWKPDDYYTLDEFFFNDDQQGELFESHDETI
jgi:hypothetical protein